MQSQGDVQPKHIAISTSARFLPRGNNAMVGFKEHETQIMEALVTNDSSPQLVPIVGMGGIGKTTLAKTVYKNPSIVHYFHIRAWVTVSQEFAVGDLLLHLLSEISKSGLYKHDRSDDEIGVLLYQKLLDRKYLIVMDDVWDIMAWDNVRSFLPPNSNGSRILVTTRLSNLANDFGSCSPYEIGLLDEENSWDLLHGQVFGKEHCPVELEEIGKGIAKKCGGLPLALVVIGGLLAKSETTKEHWEFVEGDVSSAINYGNDKHLMDILSLSYTHLPIYLRPCFLYLAVFPEDFEICVPPLLRLWVGEGLIRQTPDKCLEEVAHEYMEDLISRNLLMVHKRGSSGNVRSCKIHDLVRELCIKEAEKENFVYIAKLDSPNISPNIETKRRLSVSSPGQLEMTVIEALQSARFNRSWLSHGKLLRYSKQESDGHIGVSSEEKKLVKKTMHRFLLLKVVHVEDGESPVNISMLNNLRYVDAKVVRCISSMYVCWNLQTLVVGYERMVLPIEFWQMLQLRHLKIDDGGVILPDPPPYYEKVTILENLQTLKGVQDFKCTKKVIERIPNLKKLGIAYHQTNDSRYVTKYLKDEDYCLKNLVYFTKLESLKIKRGGAMLSDMALPISQKKLNLRECYIPWEDFSIIALLPNLEVLKLYPDATKDEVWNPIEGQFRRLKFLLIWGGMLKMWQADYTHFPCLERLVLGYVQLETIPESFAEISTLEAIELCGVGRSIWKSAFEISDIRQEELGCDPLLIRSYYDWMPAIIS